MAEPFKTVPDPEPERKSLWRKIENFMMYGGLAALEPAAFAYLQVLWLALNHAMPRIRRIRRGGFPFRKIFMRNQPGNTVPDYVRIGILVLGAIFILLEISMEVYVEFGG